MCENARTFSYYTDMLETHLNTSQAEAYATQNDQCLIDPRRMI